MKFLKWIWSFALTLVVFFTGGLFISYIGEWFSIPYVMEFTFIQAIAVYMIIRIGSLDTSAMTVGLLKENRYSMTEFAQTASNTSQIATIMMNLGWLFLAWLFHNFIVVPV